jgi:hypothetical protein
MSLKNVCKSQKNIYCRNKFYSITYSTLVFNLTVSDVRGIDPVYPGVFSWLTATVKCTASKRSILALTFLAASCWRWCQQIFLKYFEDLFYQLLRDGRPSDCLILTSIGCTRDVVFETEIPVRYFSNNLNESMLHSCQKYQNLSRFLLYFHVPTH